MDEKLSVSINYHVHSSVSMKCVEFSGFDIQLYIWSLKLLHITIYIHADDWEILVQNSVNDGPVPLPFPNQVLEFLFLAQ